MNHISPKSLAQDSTKLWGRKMLCRGRRKILHFVKGGDLESFTAQIDFTHWHKCYPLALTFLTFRPQVSLSQRQRTFLLGKADQEKISLFATVHFSPHVLFPRLFPSRVLQIVLSPHFPLSVGQTRMPLRTRYLPGFSVSGFRIFHFGSISIVWNCLGMDSFEGKT